MKPISAEEVRRAVIGLFIESIRANGLDPERLPDDCDLLELGIVDSLGVVRMVAAINEAAEGDIDFEELDFEEMTVLGKFCTYVEEYTRERTAV